MSGLETPTDTTEPLDRAAMFAAGPPRIQRRTIWIVLAVAAVLGIGGAYADHSFNVQPAPSPTPVTQTATPQHETLAQFIGVKTLDDNLAPAIDLTDSAGRSFSLSQLAGRPVILTFLGATCEESCDVVSLELLKAEATLASAHIRPAVVIINADPDDLARSSEADTFDRGQLARAGAIFLTGSLAQIQPVWRSYAVTIEVDPTTGVLAYTNVGYLIDAGGHLRDSLTPFVNESFSGDGTLPLAEINRFASGIADYLEQVAR
jgi:cytochrome oxidase Cu insertion factor (SCO1/SenC/PrrC family)